MDEQNKKKFRLFDLFHLHRDGKGVTPEEEERIRVPNLSSFFRIYKRKFGKLLSVNIFMVLGNFPFLFALIAMAGYFNTASFRPQSPLFPVLMGASTAGETSPVLSLLLSVFGGQATLSLPTAATTVLWCLSGLILFTFGYVNVGTTYLLRSFVRGDPVFMWSDFWYAVKRNRVQGMIMGILDLLFMAVIAYDLVFFYLNLGTFAMNLMFYIALLVAILYFVMRFYIYLLLITFDLKLGKILKNAFLFAILGFKRNALAILGILCLLAINVILLTYIFPLGITFPFVLLFANGAFMTTYAAYYKIKEIMIDPYQPKEESNS